MKSNTQARGCKYSASGPPVPFVRYPPDNNLHGEQEKVINNAKNHQPSDLEAKPNRRKTHQDKVAPRLSHFFLAGVVACPVEWIKVKQRRNLMIQDQANLAAKQHFHSLEFYYGADGLLIFFWSVGSVGNCCAPSCHVAMALSGWPIFKYSLPSTTYVCA